MKEDQTSTTDEVDVQVYLELWQQVLANTTEPRDENDDALVSGMVAQGDSRLRLRNHLRALKMLEVKGTQRTIYSDLQAAIDEQAWPSIPHIRETHLVKSEMFPFQPDILLDCKVRSYALDQRLRTLKLLTMRGIVTIKILSNFVGSIGIDPNLRHALNCLSKSGPQKNIREASFAQRKGNGSNASQFLVFGLLFGSMRKMGFIFCKDPGEPRSGPTGHVTLTYPPSMMDDALRQEESFSKSRTSESSKGSASSDFVQGKAAAHLFCCPYCSKRYTAMHILRLHFQKSLIDTSNSDEKHSREEISDFIRNSGQHISQSTPTH